MKTPIRYTFALFTACTVLPAAGLLAQSPSPAASTTPSVSMPAGTGAATGEHEGPGMKAISKLTPEERQKLKAAHQAALQDPAVKTAEAGRDTDKAGKKAYREAVRAAMLKADPSVKPILDKMREEREEEHPRKKGPLNGSGGKAASRPQGRDASPKQSLIPVRASGPERARSRVACCLLSSA